MNPVASKVERKGRPPHSLQCRAGTPVTAASQRKNVELPSALCPRKSRSSRKSFLGEQFCLILEGFKYILQGQSLENKAQIRGPKLDMQLFRLPQVQWQHPRAFSVDRTKEATRYRCGKSCHSGTANLPQGSL